jgi:hypothetical protein
MKWQVRAAATLGAATLATASGAVVAFSNFGPEYAYNVQSGWTVSGPTSGFPTQVVAFQFTALAGGLLTDIKLPFGHVEGTNVGEVNLYRDSGSDTVGDWMIKWWMGLPTFGQPDLITLTNPFDAPVLVAGEKYWLGAHYRADDAWNAWNMTSWDDERLGGFSYNGGDTYDYALRVPASAFEVNVVPEPASLAFLGLGAASLFARRRHPR